MAHQVAVLAVVSRPASQVPELPATEMPVEQPLSPPPAAPVAVARAPWAQLQTPMQVLQAVPDYRASSTRWPLCMQMVVPAEAATR